MTEVISFTKGLHIENNHIDRRRKRYSSGVHYYYIRYVCADCGQLHSIRVKVRGKLDTLNARMILKDRKIKHYPETVRVVKG